MRDLKWIKDANREGARETGVRDFSIDKPKPREPEKGTDDWADSHRPILNEPEKSPLLYRYVKDELRIPNSWWDHLKLDLRFWAIVNHHPNGLIWTVVQWFTGDYKTRSIPITYEIYPAPKSKGRAK